MDVFYESSPENFEEQVLLVEYQTSYHDQLVRRRVYDPLFAFSLDLHLQDCLLTIHNQSALGVLGLH